MAEREAKAQAQDPQQNPQVALEHHKWNPVRFVRKEQLSKDTRKYTFSLPAGKRSLGLATCQHVNLGFHFSDRMVVRAYTPTRPIFDREEDGTFDLVVKTYFPDQSQPGGTMSNILDCLRPGEEIEVKGPSGEIRYVGEGKFLIGDKKFRYKNITLVLGGSGITPGYQLVSRILSSRKEGGKRDDTKIKVVDANKTEADILLRSELDRLAKDHPDQFRITYVLSSPSEQWKGEKGHVTKEILQKYGFPPSEENVALLCGPPTMIQKAVLPALKAWGYREDENLFGF